MRIFTVCRRRSWFLYLLVAISLLLGMVGPAKVLAAPQAQAPDAAMRPDAVALESNPTVYTVASTSGSGSSSYISFSHTTGTGADRLMLVGVSWNANTNISPITSVTFSYGSTTLTLSPVISRRHSANLRYAAIYSLADPPSGQAGTVTVYFQNSVGSGIVAGVANFQGVDTTTPLGFPNGADGTGTALSVTVSGLAGDELVFDTVFLGGTNTSLTVGAGQTQLTGWNSAGGTTARGAASTEQAAGGSVEMSWTGSPSGVWVDVAVPIYPACIGARNTLTAGNNGHGTVTLNPAGGSYCSDRNVTVTLTPVPESGYLFNGWVGANASEIVSTGSGVNIVYTIVINGDKSVTANFSPAACQDASPLTVDDDTYLSAAQHYLQLWYCHDASGKQEYSWYSPNGVVEME